jgi:hypothetical protein
LSRFIQLDSISQALQSPAQIGWLDCYIGVELYSYQLPGGFETRSQEIPRFSGLQKFSDFRLRKPPNSLP